ncbi:MAG: DUF3344 domain-containing protein [Methanosarcinaceae archaeon]|nr:DUF3344 domain-containing protein [Methanosarcinaceae archaeon]
MTKKTDLRHIGMVMLVLCTALIMTVLPAAAYYTADKPLVTNATGTVTGGMNYTIGDSYYSPKMWSNDTYVYTVSLPNAIPITSDVHKRRLYVYWTWSFNDTSPGGAYDTSVNATMNVDFNGEANFNEPHASYVDLKYDNLLNTDDGYYNYPSGTYVYDIPNVADGPYTVNITNTYGAAYNQSFNIQAVGLLALYNTSGGNTSHYWIDEGCDLTYTAWKNTTNSWIYGFTPDDAVSLAKFTGVNTANVSSAKLITCVPAGDTPYNRLYVNYFFNYPAWQNIKYWNGLWNKNPYEDFSWAETEVKDNLIDGTNYVGFQNGLYTMIPHPYNKPDPYQEGMLYQEKQMEAANAFLLLTYN